MWLTRLIYKWTVCPGMFDDRIPARIPNVYPNQSPISTQLQSHDQLITSLTGVCMYILIILIIYIYICIYIYTYMYILHTPYSQLYVGGSHHGLYVPVRTYWCFSRHVAANLLIEMENHCSTCVKPVALCCPAHRLLSSHLPPVRHADFEGQWIEMGCVTKCGWFDRPNYGISPMNMT